jgi:hypothetical protein
MRKQRVEASNNDFMTEKDTLLLTKRCHKIDTGSYSILDGCRH